MPKYNLIHESPYAMHISNLSISFYCEMFDYLYDSRIDSSADAIVFGFGYI
jgi:hypothetical protein